MAIAAIIVKVMPDSPEADLDKIQTDVRQVLESEGAKNISFEINPIAFGLKAVMVKFAWQEEKDTSIIEEKLAAVGRVSSATITDYRRAFG